MAEQTAFPVIVRRLIVIVLKGSARFHQKFMLTTIMASAARVSSATRLRRLIAPIRYSALETACAFETSLLFAGGSSSWSSLVGTAFVSTVELLCDCPW